MSSAYSGDPANVSNSLAATVTGATNASPIVITTSAPHGYGDNDTVRISGVVGNTAANGTWKITRLSGTTFSLDGSTGNGAYVSGGAIVDRSLTPPTTIPADGDLRSAASVNAAIQLALDRTQFLAAALLLMGGEELAAVTATDTWVCPADVVGAWIWAHGGGGGGGAANTGLTSDNQYSCGGSGGGGALAHWEFVSLTPGVTYERNIGAGGNGGAAGANAGQDGSDTTFKIQGGATLATWVGAGKGVHGSTASAATIAVMARPGGPTPPPWSGATNNSVVWTIANMYSDYVPCQYGPGWGAPGITQTVGNDKFQNASKSLEGYSAGAIGADGTATGAKQGGSGGGGGAAGPSGAGGAGGAGGNGSAGTGGAGTAGTAAAANTGAGGGGAGSPGAGTTGGTAAAGGNGGSGKMRMIVMKRSGGL